MVAMMLYVMLPSKSVMLNLFQHLTILIDCETAKS
jgi:hypothetical protein